MRKRLLVAETLEKAVTAQEDEVALAALMAFGPPGLIVHVVWKIYRGELKWEELKELKDKNIVAERLRHELEDGITAMVDEKIKLQRLVRFRKHKDGSSVSFVDVEKLVSDAADMCISLNTVNEQVKAICRQC